MLSRQQITLSIHELKNFRFTSYIKSLGNGSHVIRLHVPEFAIRGLSPSISTMDYVVTEHEGYLSAVSVDGSLHFSKLS